MKKIFLAVSLLSMMVFSTINASAQQGKWAGLVKYEISWTGSVPQGIPTEWQVKVFENQLCHGDLMTFGQLGKVYINAANKTITNTYDFSMLPDEGPTEGMAGKWYVRAKIKDDDLKKAMEKVKYEYTGEVKEIAGVKCEQVKVIVKDEEGTEKSETIFVTKELGPVMDLEYYPGLDAFLMEYRLDISPEISATFTVKDLQKGKVKEVDLLLESGYEELSEEDFGEMMRVLFGAGAGEDEDDM